MGALPLAERARAGLRRGARRRRSRGTGTLLAALERGRPIVVLPRRADLRETRNDHQLATAARFAELAGVSVAWSERELPRALERLAAAPPTLRLAQEASGPLVRRIAAFLAQD
ncbi:MAG: hypothetical protein M5U28_26235 [Sandaracinaceae bacterium]|nr:hypothetical protein [Sandaracinaceae bacterium]